ncbi:uncharacterized protein LOC115999322 [Ipomoea triloba]|uniref:uncharacterized protein LOC115999322 n=1 Tax=Ipomoea triloba TaxID=35885 RepID=UPI00125E9CA8|nr:uncharacterized protein LOC115999322 [Ipomoea triloba]
MVRRAIRSIVKKVNAGFVDQFKRLRDYAQECLNSNPGSTIKIKTSRVVENAPCTFQRIYVCFGALKRGFAQGCRKVVGLDGCFLKGKLKGEILSAVSRDANNQMYPVAWAVVEIENIDSWRWFLTLLKDDLNMSNTSEWTLISDQQKGLTTVIQKLFPEIEHRNCARHIHANWSKKHRGMVFKKLFWKCAKATTTSQFDEVVKELAKRDPKASEDLLKYPPKLWCKAFFRTNVKCDAVDNNMSEAFNGIIVKARSKPIVPMLEDIRVAMMRRIAEKRRSLDKWQGNHGHLILKKLNQNVLDSVGWHVDFNGVDGFEVKQGKHQFKVKLLERTCSCRAWDLSGIPCIHAVCAIFDRKKDPVDYVHRCYSKEMYEMTYSHALEPINGELFWPRTDLEEIGAPIPRRMTGRPKKRRNREENEPRHSKTKMSRKGGSISCSMCKESGHNKRYCPRKTTEARNVPLNGNELGHDGLHANGVEGAKVADNEVNYDLFVIDGGQVLNENYYILFTALCVTAIIISTCTAIIIVYECSVDN